MNEEPSTKILQNRVKALQKKPQPEQRSAEWFIARQCRVTASEAASCLFKSRKVCEPYVREFGIENFKYNDAEPLNPYEKREDYIIKKCEGFYGTAVFKDTVFTLWGKKYEDIAGRLYTKLSEKQVLPFGLIAHSRLKWLAASPDGITSDGVMLEIKCPKSRKIVPSAPPLYYWIQVQIQLETCNLEECDFLECEIVEVTEEEFVETKPEGKQDKGVLIQLPGPQPRFIYPPDELDTTEDYMRWRDEQQSLHQHCSVDYYVIKNYNIIRIKRSHEWFNANKADIKKTWEIVMRLQGNKEDFIKYKESIHMIKSKAFHEKFERTNCLITDGTDSSFLIDKVVESDEQIENTNCMIE
jgi:putative phage-type endonuclease